jgi:hypothetical protein
MDSMDDIGDMDDAIKDSCAVGQRLLLLKKRRRLRGTVAGRQKEEAL